MATSILDQLIQEVDQDQGFNTRASYQELIEKGRQKKALTDKYALVQPIKPQEMVVPKVLPAGVRSPNAKGTPSKLESIEGRLTLEDVGLTEQDLMPERANKAGRTAKSMKKDDLYKIAQQIKAHEKEQGVVQHFRSIPPTRAPLVAELRKYFGLAPTDEDDENTENERPKKKTETEKKPRKKT